MQCKHLIDTTCYATGHPTQPTPEICRGCCRTNHGVGINEVTVLYTIQTLEEDNEPVPEYLHDYIKNPDLSHGPGTALKSILSWFVTQPPNCNCADRAELMNLWGVKGCKENISTIYGWLRESALDNNIQYSEFLIAPLVKLAIKVSEYGTKRQSASTVEST